VNLISVYFIYLGVELLFCDFKKRLSCFVTRREHHLSEKSVLVRYRVVPFVLHKKQVRVGVFFIYALVHDQNAVAIYDCCESMCDNQDSTTTKQFI